MIVHIQDAKSHKQAWDTLVKMYSTNTQARKMQLKQELHNLQKNKMNINVDFIEYMLIQIAFQSVDYGTPITT
jgi:hypothetical protein